MVTVTGNSTGDARALKEADVAIYMGFQGNSMAIENSDIVVLNDGFVELGSGLYTNYNIFFIYKDSKL